MARIEVDFEVRVDGMTHAISESLADAVHYFNQYKTDGDRVELVKVETIMVQDNSSHVENAQQR